MEPRVRVSALLRWHDRVLLCRQEKPGKEYWLLPGGGVNGGESLLDALTGREIDAGIPGIGACRHDRVRPQATDGELDHRA